eukprot:1398917-Amphidinium_carterae.1
MLRPSIRQLSQVLASCLNKSARRYPICRYPRRLEPQSSGWDQLALMHLGQTHPWYPSVPTLLPRLHIYNDASAATVPAVPADVEMGNESGGVDGTPGTPAPWTPPNFTMDPADIPVVSPSAGGTPSAEEEQGFVQDDEGMVTPEEEADFSSQPDDDEGMESAGEPEPDDECEASPQPVSSPPVTTEAAAANAWAEKID